MAAKNNYFKQNIDKFGDEFVSQIPPDQIQGQAKRIVKELIKGEIEFEKYGKYFLDLKFLENLILGITNELNENSVCYSAIVFYRTYCPNTPNITIIENKLYGLCTIYQTILSRLQAIKSTQNIGCLSDISALLYNYRNCLR